MRPTRGRPSSSSAARGDRNGNPTTAHAQLESDQLDAWLGRSVAVGGRRERRRLCRCDRRGRVRTTRVRPTKGPPSSSSGGPRASPMAIRSRRMRRSKSDQTDAYLGYSVASAGDVNGDGYADVIVGALPTTPVRPTRGRPSSSWERLGNRRRRSEHGPRPARVESGIRLPGHKRRFGRRRERGRLCRRDRRR